MNAAAPALRWANRPQQERSQKTLERILDATEKLLREGGAEAVTIPAVAKAAKSSVGSFYARFPDKTALLRTLHERGCEETEATAAAALDPARWDDVPTADLIHLLVGFCIRIFADRRTIMLAFHRAFAGDPTFAARRTKTAKLLEGHVNALLLPRRKSFTHPHPERAVGMMLRVVTATLEQRNTLEEGGAETAIADDVLAAELTSMMKAYLGVK